MASLRKTNRAQPSCSLEQDVSPKLQDLHLRYLLSLKPSLKSASNRHLKRAQCLRAKIQNQDGVAMENHDPQPSCSCKQVTAQCTFYLNLIKIFELCHKVETSRWRPIPARNSNETKMASLRETNSARPSCPRKQTVTQEAAAGNKTSASRAINRFLLRSVSSLDADGLANERRSITQGR